MTMTAMDLDDPLMTEAQLLSAWDPPLINLNDDERAMTELERGWSQGEHLAYNPEDWSPLKLTSLNTPSQLDNSVKLFLSNVFLNDDAPLMSKTPDAPPLLPDNFTDTFPLDKGALYRQWQNWQTDPDRNNGRPSEDTPKSKNSSTVLQNHANLVPLDRGASHRDREVQTLPRRMKKGLLAETATYDKMPPLVLENHTSALPLQSAQPKRKGGVLAASTSKNKKTKTVFIERNWAEGANRKRDLAYSSAKKVPPKTTGPLLIQWKNDMPTTYPVYRYPPYGIERMTPGKAAPAPAVVPDYWIRLYRTRPGCLDDGNAESLRGGHPQGWDEWLMCVRDCIEVDNTFKYKPEKDDRDETLDDVLMEFHALLAEKDKKENQCP
jgi:hypothetical protein